MSEQPPKTFLSYAREDSEFALKVSRDLKSAGANVWVDQLDISPGKHWDLSIQEALESCPRVLVALSPASVESKNVMDEVSFALEEGKDVIPVLYRPCKIPFRLRRLQYVDFTNDYRDGLTRLLDTLFVQAKEPQTSQHEQFHSPGNPAHLEVLRGAIKAGDINVWNRWRSEHPEIKPDLQAAKLYATNLIGANLSGANLWGVELDLAKLSRADLSGANLGVANLSGADLSRADLSGADLSRADLSGANLTATTLSAADLQGANLMGANLSRVDLTDARGLTQEQINGAYGDKHTELPPDLQVPPNWVQQPQ